MSGAAKTGYPPYVGEGRTVHAAKITAMSTDQKTGVTLISFGDIDSQLYAGADWIREHQPNIGGYVLASDRSDGPGTQGQFMHSQQFEQKYTLDVATAVRLQAVSNARTEQLIEKLQAQLSIVATRLEADVEAAKVASAVRGKI